MKIGIPVASALCIFFLLAGSILLFGLASSSVFPFLSFLFFFAGISILLFFMRDIFADKSDLFFLLFLGVLLALSLSFFTTEVKSYQEKADAFSFETQNVTHQIDTLSAQNQYFTNYISYLQSKIEVLRGVKTPSANAQLDQQLSALDQELEAINTTAVVPQVVPEDEPPVNQGEYEDD